MSNKIDITICLGSSCFARGNKKTVQAIEDYIKQHQLEDKVYFHGGHCFGQCEKGPNIKINGQLYENISHQKMIEIINELID